MKIKTKILLALSLSTILIVIMLASFFYYFSARHLKDEVSSRLLTAASSRANHVNTFLNMIKGRMIDFSSDGYIKNCLSALEGDRDIDCTSEDLTHHLIKNKLPTIKELSAVCTLNTKGRVIASTIQEHIGLDQSKMDFYIQGKKGAFVTDLYFSETFNKNLLTVSAPVIREGKLIGIVVGRIRPDLLYKILLDRSGLGETGEIYLVNEEGYMISPSRFSENVILKQRISPEILKSYREDYQKYGTTTGKIEKHEEKSRIVRDYRGIPVLSTHDHIPQMHWALFAEMDLKEALYPLRDLLGIFIKVGLLSFCLIYLIANWLGKKISSPIITLERGTEIIMQGDLNHKVAVPSEDEIGQLSRSFDKMTAKIKISHAELRAKNTELEQFTHTVSHDLKSPLITIKGFLGLLEKDISKKDTARIKSDIKRIDEATIQMEQLLDDLLALSRVGRIVHPPEEISLEKLTRQAAALVFNQTKARGIKVEIAPGMPVIWGDRLRIVEVFQNLIDNAAKYMGDQPSPCIEIKTRRDNSEKIVCCVRDNGIGINPRYHKKIFSLFERLDKKTEGTGVGLAIVKRIVEAHGGRIWVKSGGEGKGSTFCFTLPGTPYKISRDS